MTSTWTRLTGLCVAMALACGGLMPAEPALPPGAPGMLNLDQLDDSITFGSSRDAAWDANPEVIGRFDCARNFGVEKAKCELLTQGDTIVGIAAAFDIEHGLDRFEAAWGPPRVEWVTPTKSRYDEKRTYWYWVDEANHVTAQLERSDSVPGGPRTLRLRIWKHLPFDEWAGDGKLFPWQTRSWMGLSRSGLNNENSDINSGEFSFNLLRNSRYLYNPWVYLHFEGGRYGTELEGWEMPIFYYADKAHRSEIKKVFTAKFGKPKKAKDGATVFRSKDPRIVLRDSGIAWNLEVGVIPDKD